MVFLDRLLSACHDPDQLLTSITDEMRQIKRDKMGIAFLRAVRWLRLIPRGMDFVLHRGRCLATAVVSNCGPILTGARLKTRGGRLSIHGATLEAVEFLPPIRQRTPLAIGIVTYAGELQLTLHYDALVIAQDQAEKLASSIMFRLHGSARLE